MTDTKAPTPKYDPAKNWGLILTLGGAPDSPHSIHGVVGLYRPDVPTPVGGINQMPLKQAAALADDKKYPLELVEVADVEEAEATIKKDHAEAQKAHRAVRSRKGLTAVEKETLASQRAAIQSKGDN